MYGQGWAMLIFMVIQFGKQIYDDITNVCASSEAEAKFCQTQLALSEKVANLHGNYIVYY